MPVGWPSVPELPRKQTPAQKRAARLQAIAAGQRLSGGKKRRRRR